MDPSIEKLLQDILLKEGGLSDDPDDKGGLTKFGISQKAFPSLDIASLTPERAKQIYYERYVIAPRIHLLPTPLQALLTDYAVNSGPGVAIKALQRVLRITEDGMIGNETLKALVNADLRKVTNGVVRERVMMLGRIVVKAPKQVKFLSGWLKRALSFLQ